MRRGRGGTLPYETIESVLQATAMREVRWCTVICDGSQ